MRHNIHKWLLVQAIFIPFFVFGQEGIHFESNLPWNELLTKAKSENRFIFLDCYTTWCGPCKYMAAEIFSQKEVGDYFNTRFINVAMQMDKTSHDLKDIKDWYYTADSISKQFKVNIYPTYLFFSPDGKVVHRIVGRTTTMQEFISEGKDAVDSLKQYYTLVEHWNEHEGDSLVLMNALRAFLGAGDNTRSKKVCDQYIESLKSPVSIDNIKLFEQLVYSSENKTFKFFLKNVSEINALMGESYVERLLSTVITREEIDPFFLKEKLQLNWKMIASHLKNRYPSLGEKLMFIEKEEYDWNILKQVQTAMPTKNDTLINWDAIEKRLEKRIFKEDFNKIYLQQKAGYYARKNSWPDCLNNVYSLLRQYGNQIDSRDMNNIAWDYVFLHCNNPRIIQETVKWMKRITDKDPNQSNNLDTYANLLYKLGQKDEAIFWERKAIEIGNKNNGDLQDLKEFNDNLEKMESGRQTWNGNS